MSLCNYCILKEMKMRAKKNKTRIVTCRSTKIEDLGGIEVHELKKKGEKPKEKSFRVWFMTVTDHCMC